MGDHADNRHSPGADSEESWMASLHRRRATCQEGHSIHLTATRETSSSGDRRSSVRVDGCALGYAIRMAQSPIRPFLENPLYHWQGMLGGVSG